jgi:hypothetical protein
MWIWFGVPPAILVLAVGLQRLETSLLNSHAQMHAQAQPMAPERPGPRSDRGTRSPDRRVPSGSCALSRGPGDTPNGVVSAGHCRSRGPGTGGVMRRQPIAGDPAGQAAADVALLLAGLPALRRVVQVAERAGADLLTAAQIRTLSSVARTKGPSVVSDRNRADAESPADAGGLGAERPARRPTSRVSFVP